MASYQSSLQSKVGVLTGGTSGFGYAINQACLERGARMAIFSVDELAPEAQRAVEEQYPGQIQYCKKDITAPGASEEMVAQTLQWFGQVDFVVANAGFAIRFEESLLKLPIDRLIESMRIQFEVFPIAFASLALAAARVMAPRYERIEPAGNGHRPDSGAIVVTLSEAALNPLRDDLLAYAAAKHASLAVMESLAATLGPRNIRVNGIAPGFANTVGPRKFYDRFPQIKADIEARAHLKPSFIDPGAVVPAVLYLLTDNYVTGEVIPLDGGFNITMNRYFQNQ
jgi:3-oxoacyl-[acyl-carrier protein] reductase